MNYSRSDCCAMNMWQRLYFNTQIPDARPDCRADAWRRLLAQLEILTRSEGVSRHLYTRLLQQFFDSYCEVIDSQEPEKGLNNFAETVLTLVSGHRNESQDWTSSLSLDRLQKLPIYQCLLKRAMPSLPVHPGKKRKVTSPCSDGDSLNPVYGNPNPGKRVHVHDASRKIGSTFPASENELISSIPTSNFQFDPTMKDPRLELLRKPAATHFEGCEDTRFLRNTSDTPSHSHDEEQESKATCDFITAKQKYVIDSKQKNFHHEDDSGFLKQQGAINNVNYGSARRTLGTRRGPSHQFIPPVLNRSDDADGLQRSASTCSSGFPNYSGKGQNVKAVSSDSEVDERLKNIEPKMVELITNEIMDHGPQLSWDDVAGLEFAKNVIKEIVVWPMLRPDIFKGLRGPPKGILLFGPPGTGKTLIGKCIASQSKATFFSISASSLTSKWVGEGEKMVRALFAVARCHLPAVVFIDEIDSLLSQRTDGEHDASRRIKTEFLVQLDGATTNSDERLLVVGATNRPQEIDEAARRRLVKRLYIPLPDAGAREQIMCSLLAQQKCSLSQQNIIQIVQQTHGYSGSDMANLCREAALGPIRSITDIQHIDAEQVRPIVFEDFDEALHQVRASVSEKDLDLYIQWNTLYGSGTK